MEKTQSNHDAERVRQTLDKLRRHGLDRFCITGSLALQAHRSLRAESPLDRPINDIDIVVESLDSVPEEIAHHFLVRHLHPRAQTGNIVIQLVDAEQTLRIDIFSERGATLDRSIPADCYGATFRIASIEDLAARSARLLMDLERGKPVGRKYALDFSYLSDAADDKTVEVAWRDHRREEDPKTFHATDLLIRELVSARAHLLVPIEYSRNPEEICTKCEERGYWRLAPATTVMSILGYV